jgi:hypothetical protein
MRRKFAGGPADHNPAVRIARKIVEFFVGILTKPIRRYSITLPNDMAALKRHIRKGDVLLVEGNQRISECIKYLTQSSWSHSALYIGDEATHGDPVLASRVRAEYGAEADFMLIEALVESGVVLSPLSKYRAYNIRLCRPYRLSPEDVRTVTAHAIASVGMTYDLRNIFDLARYFMPVSIVPPRLGREALHFGSGEPTQAICSSLIAECFRLVHFPIIPRFEPASAAASKAPTAPLAEHAEVRILPPSDAFDGVFYDVSPTLITPRDFDLSPYFEIVKFNVIENLRFDYHSMVWAEGAEPPPPAGKRA